MWIMSLLRADGLQAATDVGCHNCDLFHTCLTGPGGWPLIDSTGDVSPCTKLSFIFRCISPLPVFKNPAMGASGVSVFVPMDSMVWAKDFHKFLEVFRHHEWNRFSQSAKCMCFLRLV